MMHRVRLFFIGIILALTGCDTIYKPEPVQIPVEVPCKITNISVPEFPLQSTPVSAPLDTKVKAALEEILQRRIYEDQLNAAIKVCGG